MAEGRPPLPQPRCGNSGLRVDPLRRASEPPPSRGRCSRPGRTAPRRRPLAVRCRVAPRNRCRAPRTRWSSRPPPRAGCRRTPRARMRHEHRRRADRERTGAALDLEPHRRVRRKIRGFGEVAIRELDVLVEDRLFERQDGGGHSGSLRLREFRHLQVRILETQGVAGDLERGLNRHRVGSGDR